MDNKTKNTGFVKALATELGFSFCGISPAKRLTEEASKLEQWLRLGYHGEMSYMERNFDKRLDPQLLVPNAKSVISLLYNYYPKRSIAREGVPKISKYAYGEDYHHVIKKKLKHFMGAMRREIGQVEGRAFVDSAPVMERVWSKKSGLGWIGKNSLLLNRNMGSFFFLAEIIVDLAFDYDGPIKDYCGSCTACMDNCPTGAIPEPYVVNGSRCISYFTIELKEEIPAQMQGKFANWVFGCDICQDVCPWNRFAKPNEEERFTPKKELDIMDKKDWWNITEQTFARLFGRSAVKRANFKGLKRNITFVRLRE